MNSSGRTWSTPSASSCALVARRSVVDSGADGQRYRAALLASIAAMDDLFDVAGRILEERELDVVWLAKDPRRGPVLRVAPMSVAMLVRDKVFEDDSTDEEGDRTDHTVVLTSATLELPTATTVEVFVGAEPGITGSQLGKSEGADGSVTITGQQPTEGQYVTVCVSDTGTDMAPEVAAIAAPGATIVLAGLLETQRGDVVADVGDAVLVVDQVAAVLGRARILRIGLGQRGEVFTLGQALLDLFGAGLSYAAQIVVCP